MKHSVFSPSAAHRWMRCPASVFVEAGEPNESSPYAELGTQAHELAAQYLMTREIYTSDAEMEAAVKFYEETVASMAGAFGQVHVETRVDFSQALGVENAFGTSDCIIVKGDTLTVLDFKYGTGVKVEARGNEQMQLYAIGALDTLGLRGKIESVLLGIIQPRIGNLSTWMIPIGELEEFEARARVAADQVSQILARGQVVNQDFTPGEKQCRFCRFRSKCQPLAEHVYRAVVEDFQDLETTEVLSNARDVQAMAARTVGELMAEVDLIEAWCKDLRARCERDLHAGIDIPGWKLVAGKKGHRKWSDPYLAAAQLRGWGLDDNQIYEQSLISPAQVEKLMKAGALSKEQFAKLEASISRPDGKPTVAPASDRRPGIGQVDLFQTQN